MICVSNLGHVGLAVVEYLVLPLRRLVVNLLLRLWAFGGLVGLWHDFVFLSQLVRLTESKK